MRVTEGEIYFVWCFIDYDAKLIINLYMFANKLLVYIKNPSVYNLRKIQSG